MLSQGTYFYTSLFGNLSVHDPSLIYTCLDFGSANAKSEFILYFTFDSIANTPLIFSLDISSAHGKVSILDPRSNFHFYGSNFFLDSVNTQNLSLLALQLHKVCTRSIFLGSKSCSIGT